ncbi:MAG: dephospho-CoA kinase [Selenomonadaceae bacterium]|nr:dephospho-CoA kinase [Selenomonadaceae bacterium]
MYVVGVTGGIASGKSAVGHELEKLGAKILDVDKITRELLKSGGELFNAYVRHFGEIILDADGNLNKKVVADIIFNDETARRWVNSVAHPMLLKRTRDFLADCAAQGISLVVLEVPLLYEVGWEFLVDEVWAVYVDKETQISRLMKRDGITAEQARGRIDSQMSSKEIAERADVVICNNQNSRRKLRKNILDVARQRLPAMLSLKLET